MSIPKEDERTPGRFRKMPVVIDAMRYTGGPESRAAVLEFAGLSAPNALTIYWRFNSGDGRGELVIRTLEGDLIGREGDWIVRGVQGEIYPCKPDIFAETYEPADGAQSGSFTSLREALANLVGDVLDYERTNGLHPNPGRKFCWQSTENACALLQSLGVTVLPISGDVDARAALSGATSELENLRAIVAAIRTYRAAIYRDVVPEDELLGIKEWHALEALLDAQSATKPCKKCGGSGWRDAIDGSDGSYITSRPCSCGGQPSTEVEKISTDTEVRGS